MIRRSDQEFRMMMILSSRVRGRKSAQFLEYWGTGDWKWGGVRDQTDDELTAKRRQMLYLAAKVLDGLWFWFCTPAWRSVGRFQSSGCVQVVGVTSDCACGCGDRHAPRSAEGAFLCLDGQDLCATAGDEIIVERGTINSVLTTRRSRASCGNSRHHSRNDNYAIGRHWDSNRDAAGESSKIDGLFFFTI